jgi:polysaccharide chain length determinant protein (PEP-CTERM system associated)
MTGGRQLQEYEEQDEGFSFDTQDIGVLVKRRKWHVILPAVLLFPVVVAVAFLLPSIYRSEAMILVERPNVPPELVSTTVTSTLMERVYTIQRRFLATENLKDFALRHDLYQEGESDQSLLSFIGDLRESITVNLVPTEQRQGPNIAFSVSSESHDPYVAHLVTKELVDWYMKENAQARQRQAESASQFLAKEAATLKEEIGRLEKELADLRVKYDGSLPSQRDQNLQQLSRLQEQMAALDFEAETLRERKRSLQDELALVPAYGPYVVGEERVLGPEEQLKALELQLMELSGQYTSAHPDIIGLRQKIETLKGRVASRTGSGSAAPDNPRYLRLQEQIQTIDRDLDVVARRRGAIETQSEEIQQRLAKTEEIEQQHNALVRDYQNATEDYAAIRRKELTADLGQSLEAEQMSERFSLIEPPDVPKQPASPNRLLILFAGGLLSVGAGFATGVMAELLDPAIHGSKRLAKITGAAPLVVVPYIRTRAEIHRVWLRYGLFVLLLLILVGAGLAFVHLQVTPLDVLWLKISG